MPGRVGVVEQTHGVAGGRGKQLLSLDADPALIHIGGGHGHAVTHDRREGAADRPAPAEVLDQLRHDRRDGVRLRWLGRVDAMTFGGQLSRLQVHDRALDAAAADIDS
jgi:hypothetical protein